MQKVISFRDAGGELYDIPEDETEAFRRDMPQAQAVRVFRDADGALYDIPEAEAEAFTRARPQAEPVRSVRTADGEIFDVPESERATFLKGYRTEPEFQADREAVRAKVRSAAGPDESVAAAAARGAVEGFGRGLAAGAMELGGVIAEGTAGAIMRPAARLLGAAGVPGMENYIAESKRQEAELRARAEEMRGTDQPPESVLDQMNRGWGAGGVRQAGGLLTGIGLLGAAAPTLGAATLPALGAVQAYGQGGGPKEMLEGAVGGAARQVVLGGAQVLPPVGAAAAGAGGFAAIGALEGERAEELMIDALMGGAFAAQASLPTATRAGGSTARARETLREAVRPLVQSNWWRNLTVQERGLVLRSAEAGQSAATLRSMGAPEALARQVEGRLTEAQRIRAGLRQGNRAAFEAARKSRMTGEATVAPTAEAPSGQSAVGSGQVAVGSGQSPAPATPALPNSPLPVPAFAPEIAARVPLLDTSALPPSPFAAPPKPQLGPTLKAAETLMVNRQVVEGWEAAKQRRDQEMAQQAADAKAAAVEHRKAVRAGTAESKAARARRLSLDSFWEQHHGTFGGLPMIERILAGQVFRAPTKRSGGEYDAWKALGEKYPELRMMMSRKTDTGIPIDVAALQENMEPEQMVAQIEREWEEYQAWKDRDGRTPEDLHDEEIAAEAEYNLTTPVEVAPAALKPGDMVRTPDGQWRRVEREPDTVILADGTDIALPEDSAEKLALQAHVPAGQPGIDEARQAYTEQERAMWAEAERERIAAEQAAQTAVDNAPTMAEKWRALDEWKSANPEAAQDADTGEAIQGRAGMRYRSFDSPDEATGIDRSSSTRPFLHGGAYEIEYSGTAKPIGPSQPEGGRGTIDPASVTRVFYEPEYWTPETRAQQLASDLPQLRSMFPNAEFVAVRLADDAETRVASPLALRPDGTLAGVQEQADIRFRRAVTPDAARQTEAQRQEMLARAAAPLPASTGDQTAVLPGMESEVEPNLFDAADIEARRALDLPPIETQAVAEQKPVEQSAPTTAPASKPPELMTPEEYNRGILSFQTGFGSGVQPILVRRDSGGTEWIETGIKGEPYNGNPTTFLRSLETGKERLWPVNEVSRMPTFAASHKDLVADAARYKRPVSALAVDAYGTQLPPGYVREGDRYVFRGEDATPTAAPVEQFPVAEPKVDDSKPAGESSSNAEQAKRETLEAQRQLLLDIMETRRLQGQASVPSHRRKLAELDALLKGEPVEDGAVASEQLFGHPEATNIGGGKYSHLLPIRVADRESVERFRVRAQKALDEVQSKLSTAEAITKGTIKGNKKQAQAYLASQQAVEDSMVRDLLRSETLPELRRLHDALPPSSPTAPSTPPPAQDIRGADTAQAAQAARKPPELMTPDEFEVFAVGEAEQQHRRHGTGGPFIINDQIGFRVRSESQHRREVSYAIDDNNPVSAAAVDAYKIKLPEGYVREGDRYVFKGGGAPAAQPADFALTARRMTDGGSVRGPKGTEWIVRGNQVEVAHAVTGREMGTIDLETGEVTPQKTSDKDVLEAIANEIRAQSKTYANEAELDRLKQYPFKPRNAARIKELEAQAPAQDLRAAAAAAGGGEQETGTNPTGPTIIDRSTDARPGWTTEYSSSDFGTERLVTVRDDKGNIIGQRDPFMGGIPVNPKRRTARIRQVAKEIVRDYDSAMERQAREAAAPSSAPAAPESPAQDIQSAAAAAGRSGAARGMAQADGTGLPGQMEAPDAAAVPADNPHYSIFPIELPEAVDFARQATGKFPKVKKRIRLLGGTALGVYRSTAQGPLGIELKRSIFNLITDQDRARIAAEAEAWAAVNLEGNPEGELWTSAVQDRITEETDKLREQRLKENPRLASSVLLHEVGHWIDNVPDYETMMKRGNILGHLQALHGYTKQMMMEHPDTLEAAIRPRERARMRREAERAAGRRPADDAERKVWSEEVSTHYQDMLQEEAARRGLVTRAQILSELEPLIAWWHGTDSIPEYFTDPAEMYADAFSVLANNPAAMRKRAPTYFKVWQNWLAKRPQARELWERYQMDATLGRVGDMRDRRQMEGIEAANFEHEKQLRARMVWSPRQNLDALGSMLYSGAYPITRRAKKLMKRGVESGDRMMKALQDERYRHAWGAAYMMEVQDKVGRRVFAEAGVPLAEWRAFLQNRQIAENRQGIASMMGMNPAASSEALERQRQRMGDAAYNAMMQAQAQWHALRQKYVINLALEKGLVTQELADMMEQRAAYSHVAAVDADVDPVEAIFRGAYGEAGAKIYKQEGFLGLARDPWQATLELDRSLITAAYRNELKAALESMLADSGEELYRDAGTKWDANVKRMVPVTGESARASTLVYMRNGKPRSYWAPQEIVDFVDNADPVSARVLTSLINTLLRKQKGVFTWLNYGFPIFNTPRDIQDWIRNLPGWKGRLTYYHYAKRARPLVQSIVDGRPTEEAAELMRQNILLLYPQGLEPGQDRFLQSLGQKIGGRVGRALEATGPQTALERTIQGYGLRPEWMGMDVNTRQDLMQRVKRWYLSPTEKGEMLRKVSAWLYLRDRFPDMSAEDVQRNVQMMGGSPDFADRARKNAVIDAVFPFYNPFLRGWQSALTAFAREPVRVTLTTMRYGVVPKLILAAIGAGYMRELLKRLLGDLGDKIGKEQQKMVQYIPQYYKDNYAVHPLWWDPTDPTGTKVVFETSPLSEFNRFAGATIWSLLDGGDIKSILDVGAEQLPGINPVLTLASQWAQVYSGRPPAGTGITQTQIDAGAAVSPMMRETWNQLSGGMLGRIPREGIGDVNLSPLEKFLRLPGVSNTLGRRLRVSNKGFSEGLREAAKPAERERAKVRTEAWRDALEYARTGTLPVEAAVRQARGAMTMAMKPDGRDTSSYLALLPVEQSRDAYYVERLHDYMLQMNIAKLAPREQAMLKAPWTQKAELLRGYGKPPVDKPSR